MRRGGRPERGSGREGRKCSTHERKCFEKGKLKGKREERRGGGESGWGQATGNKSIFLLGAALICLNYAEKINARTQKVRWSSMMTAYRVDWRNRRSIKFTDRYYLRFLLSRTKLGLHF